MTSSRYYWSENERHLPFEDIIANSQASNTPNNNTLKQNEQDSLKLPSVPCRPEMAERVLFWAAAAGSNYWSEPWKWGQIHCIIREPVDSGSPPQWLVINKIIAGRWWWFLEFLLICMPFFFTKFLWVFSCGGWVVNDTLYGESRLCFGFKLRRWQP